ncbi:AGE family epimerase/isomerase [Priestia aryabhattai]|uniref:AGE family epimerase/isomerase n=1 Tax=Priestia aryabhattai TaxID=412384 RepID=UPI003D2E8275
MAYKAGMEEAREVLDNVYNVAETHFWDSEYEFYKVEWDESWTALSSYRGQNSKLYSLGLSDEEIQHYLKELNWGRILVFAIKTDDFTTNE